MMSADNLERMVAKESLKRFEQLPEKEMAEQIAVRAVEGDLPHIWMEVFAEKPTVIYEIASLLKSALSVISVDNERPEPYRYEVVMEHGDTITVRQAIHKEDAYHSACLMLKRVTETEFKMSSLCAMQAMKLEQILNECSRENFDKAMKLWWDYELNWQPWTKDLLTISINKLNQV